MEPWRSVSSCLATSISARDFETACSNRASSDETAASSMRRFETRERSRPMTRAGPTATPIDAAIPLKRTGAESLHLPKSTGDQPAKRSEGHFGVGASRNES